MQKFSKGDHVRVAKDLGPSMSHFPADCEAIVIGSYKDQYGGSDVKSYTIHLKDGGETSWYDECQLELIEPGRTDLLKQWEEEREAEASLKGGLDWIFQNGESVLARPHGASLETLGLCLGINDMWGSHGEGYAYLMNAQAVLTFAEPYLRRGDRAGFERQAAIMTALED